jgi:catechol 2,3-dioxygenase-like lactoylglutathione lyase family enzyme
MRETVPTAQEAPMADTKAATTITDIANVIIPVDDQDKAIEFYVGTLGCELVADIPFAGQYRWVEVAPAGAATHIALAPPPAEGGVTGAVNNIALSTTDIEAAHADLRSRGVDVDEEISRMGDPVPPMFWFRDPEGNTLLMVQSA